MYSEFKQTVIILIRGLFGINDLKNPFALNPPEFLYSKFFDIKSPNTHINNLVFFFKFLRVE